VAASATVLPAGAQAAGPAHARGAVVVGQPAPGPLASAPAAGPDAPIVCIVDGGVQETPGTSGHVVARSSVTEAPGLEDSTSGHGTLVAAAALSVWPQARIASVRATTNGLSEIRHQIAAVDRCGELGASVINISIGGPHPGPAWEALMREAVGRAVAQGRDVVVAAGNTPGPPAYPAVSLGDLAVVVDAVDATGARCAFASTGPQVTVGALGCPAWLPTGGPGEFGPVSGSSVAAPQVAAVLAALRTYAPALDGAGRRAALTGLPGAVLDQAEVLRRVGRTDLLPAAPAPTLRLDAVQQPVTMPTIPSPTLRVRWSGRGATVTVRRSPVGIRLTVRGGRRAVSARASRVVVPRRLLRGRRALSVVVADRTGATVLKRRVSVPSRSR
jgi:hypothetical protein